MSNAPSSPEPETSPTTSVFLSYSRRDEVFMRRLAAALHERSYAPNFDQSDYDPVNISGGISAEDEWWQRLEQMIVAADVMVFIVSPDSAASKVCDEEIAFAREVGKRLIPIECRPIDYAEAPPRLAAKNVKIKFTVDGEDRFQEALDDLCAVIDVDIAWHRENRRLTELAIKWGSEGRPDDRVLSDADIRAAEQHFERRPKNTEPPAEVLSEFLDHSRTTREEERKRLRRTAGRAFVKPAEEANARGEHEHALRLAAAGTLLAEDISFKLVPELWPPIQMAILNGRTKCIVRGHGAAAQIAAFHPDGNRLVIGGPTLGEAQIWSVESGAQIAKLKASDHPIQRAMFSPDGAHLISISTGGRAGYQRPTTLLWDTERWIPIYAFEGTCIAFHNRILATELTTGAVQIWNIETGLTINTLMGLNSSIVAASFCLNGRHLAISLGDNTARRWDVASGTQIAAVAGDEGLAFPTAINPDGSRVITGGWDESVKIWDFQNSVEIAAVKNVGDPYGRIEFSDDGNKALVISRKNSVHILDAKNGLKISALDGHKGMVCTASFSPDGMRVVTGSSDLTVRIWDVESGAQIHELKGHTAKIVTAAFSPEGRMVVTGSEDCTLRVWDVSTNSIIAASTHSHGNFAANLLGPAGDCFATIGRSGELCLWDAERLSEPQTLGGPNRQITAWSFSPDGGRVVTGSYDNTVRIWCADAGAELMAIKDSLAPLSIVSFSQDGRRVFTGCSDGSGRVWNIANGLQLAALRGHKDRILAAAFSANGTRIVTVSADQTARLWDAETGGQIASLRSPNYLHSVSAAFTPDGRHLVIDINDNCICLWLAETGAEVAVLKGNIGRISRASFSRDGKRLVAGSAVAYRSDVGIWDVETGRQVLVLRGHRGNVWAASYSPDGQRVVTGSSDNTARVWDAETGVEIVALRAHNADVVTTSFSPDSKRVLTGSIDGTVRLWNAHTGVEITAFEVNNARIRTVLFNHDGRRVVAGDDSATMYDVSRTATITRSRGLLITAALARGIGLRSEIECADLLMQDAPEDLFAEALRQLGPTADDPELLEVIAALRAPLHPNCYLSPTQFAEKFGLKAPRAIFEAQHVDPTGESVADDDETGPDDVSQAVAASGGKPPAGEREGQAALQTEPPAAISRYHVTADDLPGQAFVETCRGVAIFRLSDGRYHVVNHFAVATLDDARAAAEEVSVAGEVA